MIVGYVCYSHYWPNPELMAGGMFARPGKVVCWIC